MTYWSSKGGEKMEKNLNLPHILTAKDIQLYLRISKGKAYNLMNEEGFPTVTIGGNKRVKRDDFLTWIDNHTNGVKKHA